MGWYGTKKGESLREISKVVRPGEALLQVMKEAARADSPIVPPYEKKLPRIEAMFHNWRLSGVKQRALDMFLDSGWADKLFYHNAMHTVDVYWAAVRYGELERISTGKYEILTAAAIFHDLGFLRQYKYNEPFGAKIAQEIGSRFEYGEDELKLIGELIMDTTMPQQPRSHLGKILCDCDLDNLGRSDFAWKGLLVRLELAVHDNKIMSDLQWLEFQEKFLKGHRFWTKSARVLREEHKRKNLEQVSEMVEVMRKRA